MPLDALANGQSGGGAAAVALNAGGSSVGIGGAGGAGAGGVGNAMSTADEGHRARLGVFPIGIEPAKLRATQQKPATQQRILELQAKVRLCCKRFFQSFQCALCVYCVLHVSRFWSFISVSVSVSVGVF